METQRSKEASTRGTATDRRDTQVGRQFCSPCLRPRSETDGDSVIRPLLVKEAHETSLAPLNRPDSCSFAHPEDCERRIGGKRRCISSEAWRKASTYEPEGDQLRPQLRRLGRRSCDGCSPCHELVHGPYGLGDTTQPLSETDGKDDTLHGAEVVPHGCQSQHVLGDEVHGIQLRLVRCELTNILEDAGQPRHGVGQPVSHRQRKAFLHVVAPPDLFRWHLFHVPMPPGKAWAVRPGPTTPTVAPGRSSTSTAVHLSTHTRLQNERNHTWSACKAISTHTL